MLPYFQYSREPIKSIYLICFFLSFLVRIPFWALTNLLPSWRPRRSWPLSRTIRVKFMRTLLGGLFQTSFDMVHVDPEKLGGTGEGIQLVWVEPTPDLVVGEIQEAAKINNIESVRLAGVWYGGRGKDANAASQPAGPDEKVFYELHGGGWVIGNAGKKWDSAYFCERMVETVEGYNSAFQIEYRKSRGPPFLRQGAFPAAIIDAVAGYNYLVKVLGFKPSNIIVTGESAGGNLAFALVRYLNINNFPSLPIPRAQFLLCPTADWGRSHVGPESAMERNTNSDYVHWFVGGWGANALRGALPESELINNSWISPGGLRMPHVKGQFAGMPPTLIMAGDAEMTLDGVTTLRDRILADNPADTLTYIEYPDTTHVAMTVKWHEPQATQGYVDLAKWVESFDGDK
ncbi:uncharacterized protein FIBRA_09603 [Fibroporia radiculosa]|uniref:Alpha/beta hydrolase fold-3 domain-containing protein n=1 Tax=Fibroporia radiculosa TaxID=599839 RepID=J7RI54_9APHY|nr:uncharacterized protein FIBRA_09603 [Fibroporia radiculosa]CCM07257.1 predicted protein [Fibroporia radiculosa]